MAANNESNMPSMITIGEKLRQARERKGLDIGQVQKQTHIHSTVLIALEDGRCDEILTPTYVRGFLKKYAYYLGLDATQLLKEYASLHGDEPESQNIILGTPEKNSGIDWSILLRYARIIFILILVFFLATFLWRKVTSSKKARPKNVKVAKHKMAVTVAPAKISPQKKVAQKSILVKQADVKIVKPFNLVMKVNEPVWVEATKDGVLLFKRFLPKGTVESFSADESIVLYVARAEAIELVLDGKSLGSPGSGLVKHLEITRSGARIK